MISKTRYINSKIFTEVIFCVVLLMVVVQLTRGIIINVNKYNVLSNQLSTIDEENKLAIKRNAYLKEKVQSHLDPTLVEALARKYLNLAGKNEVVVKIEEEEN